VLAKKLLLEVNSCLKVSFAQEPSNLNYCRRDQDCNKNKLSEHVRIWKKLTIDDGPVWITQSQDAQNASTDSVFSSSELQR